MVAWHQTDQPHEGLGVSWVICNSSVMQCWLASHEGLGVSWVICNEMNSREASTNHEGLGVSWVICNGIEGVIIHEEK